MVKETKDMMAFYLIFADIFYIISYLFGTTIGESLHTGNTERIGVSAGSANITLRPVRRDDFKCRLYMIQIGPPRSVLYFLEKGL
jgi:hypothetical protein